METRDFPFLEQESTAIYYIGTNERCTLGRPQYCIGIPNICEPNLSTESSTRAHLTLDGAVVA